MHKILLYAAVKVLLVERRNTNRKDVVSHIRRLEGGDSIEQRQQYI